MNKFLILALFAFPFQAFAFDQVLSASSPISWTDSLDTNQEEGDVFTAPSCFDLQQIEVDGQYTGTGNTFPLVVHFWNVDASGLPIGSPLATISTTGSVFPRDISTGNIPTNRGNTNKYLFTLPTPLHVEAGTNLLWTMTSPTGSITSANYISIAGGSPSPAGTQFIYSRSAGAPGTWVSETADYYWFALYGTACGAVTPPPPPPATTTDQALLDCQAQNATLVAQNTSLTTKLNGIRALFSSSFITQLLNFLAQ